MRVAIFVLLVLWFTMPLVGLAVSDTYDQEGFWITVSYCALLVILSFLLFGHWYTNWRKEFREKIRRLSAFKKHTDKVQ